MPVKGLKVCTPTSIAYSGTSASINSDGSVSFTAMTNLQLRGVFSADYDNYIITVTDTRSTSNGSISFQLLSGTTPASGANYARQYLQASGASVPGSRSTGQTSTRLGWADTALNNGLTAYVFGPYLAQPTAVSSVTVWSYLNGSIEDYASTHSLSTSYDGCVVFPSAGSMTGLVSVAGWVQ
jgi:hypothetical protein